jgi:hypothetical protein
MRKIALITLLTLPLALPLMADFFPQTVHTTIASVSNDTATLKASFPANGMSGIVEHNYGNEHKAITHMLVQNSAKNVSIIKQDILHHDSLPSIKTALKAGDKVIGGYLYKNVLLLAPDAATYAKITSSHEKSWIHPDLYAVFLSQVGDAKPTKQNLAAFAKSHQVGLVYIVTNGTAKLLDPISGNIIAMKTLSELPAQGQAPFFMRLEEINAGFFTSENKATYYQLMDTL